MFSLQAAIYACLLTTTYASPITHSSTQPNLSTRDTNTTTSGASSSVVQGLLGTDGYWNDFDGGVNTYILYTGNGSVASGWPSATSWVSFNELWTTNQHIISRSCSDVYNQSNNTPQETLDLYSSIKQIAHESRVDHRFILATIMQESKGCVRAASSVSADGIHNPGMLQDFKGTHTCNDNGKVSYPCPSDQILGMIRDGIMGTASGNGFAQDINAQYSVVDANTDFAEAHYRAARLYNSGAIDSSGDLGKGSATHCYASDIANRLRGWVDAPSKCTLDSTTSNSSTTT